MLSKDNADRLSQDAYSKSLKLLPDLRIEENAKRFITASKPAWMTDDDYSEYKSEAERTLKVAQDELTNAAAAKKNNSENLRLFTESRQLAQDREKVLKQLKILSELLVDASSIDRIESYDNPFAPGNFEMLRTIAQRLGQVGLK